MSFKFRFLWKLNSLMIFLNKISNILAVKRLYYLQSLHIVSLHLSHFILNSFFKTVKIFKALAYFTKKENETLLLTYAMIALHASWQYRVDANLFKVISIIKRSSFWLLFARTFVCSSIMNLRNVFCAFWLFCTTQIHNKHVKIRL